MTFLDTPGHEAFQSIRERGSHVTDIAIIVISAEDGLMPQTREAISLVKKYDVPFVIAVNKMDRVGPERLSRLQTQLDTELGVTVEDLGGDIQCRGISALKGTGVMDLMACVALEADNLTEKLVVSDEGAVDGSVLEVKRVSGKGLVCTVILKRGKCVVGDWVALRGDALSGHSGFSYGKLRSIVDPDGKSVKACVPGVPYLLDGWKVVDGIRLPHNGDRLMGPFHSERAVLAAKAAALSLEPAPQDEVLESDSAHEKETWLDPEEAPNQRLERAKLTVVAEDTLQPHTLRLFLVTDVQGSMEALSFLLRTTLRSALVHVVVVGNAPTGTLTDDDAATIQLTGASVVAFQCTLSDKYRRIFQANKIRISESAVVYHLIDQIHAWMTELLPTEPFIEVKGRAEILELYHLNVKPPMTVYGCSVLDGAMRKSSNLSREGIRILRHNSPLIPSSLQDASSTSPYLFIKDMKHVKRDIQVAPKGTECGIVLGSSVGPGGDINLSIIEKGDILEYISVSQVPVTPDWQLK
jgi:translation initiation factor IF-2